MSRSGSEREKRLLRQQGREGRESRINRQRFERLVSEALDDIPEPFRSRLQNVAIVVEERPSRQLLESLGMSGQDTLLGLYDGIPLTERGDWYNLVMPDRITLFRQPIMEACSSPEEVRQEVRRTVLHEIAHFYGIGDDELQQMGLY